MTGGEQKIHITISQQEAAHDIALILGKTIDEIRRSSKSIEIETIRHDLTGTYGWESLTELFHILNECTNYVVLRNFDEIDSLLLHGYKKDVDLLVENMDEASLIINGKQRIEKEY